MSVFSFFGFTDAAGGVLSGSGTEGDPYIVEDCQDLLAAVDETAYYQLANDIDCTSEGEIGPLFGEAVFSGGFDGASHSITGLDIASVGPGPAGLFAGTNSASIHDLTIAGSISSTANEVASLIGRMEGQTILNNITSNFTVTGPNYIVGGLVGDVEMTLEDADLNGYPTITNASFSGTITAGTGASGSTIQNLGGLIGIASYLDISDSDSNATITVTDYSPSDVGGFAGGCYGCIIADSSAQGAINIIGGEPSNLGGFIGFSTSTQFTDSSSAVNLQIGTAENPAISVSSIGGFVGNMEITNPISNSFSDQNISIYLDIDDLAFNGGQFIGGFIGNLCSAADITDCYTQVQNSYSLSNITVHGGDDALSNIGGITGMLQGTQLSSVYAEGDITIDAPTGVQFVGGLVGYATEMGIEDSHYAGTMTIDVADPSGGLADIGGLVGYSELDPLGGGGGPVSFAPREKTVASNNFWDGILWSRVLVLGLPDLGPVNDIENSYSEGSILIGQTTSNDTAQFIGGLIGHHENGGTVTDSYSKMDILVAVADYAHSIGGISGYVNSDNSEDYNTLYEGNYYYGDIVVSVAEGGTTSQFVGGYIGKIDALFGLNAQISNSFSGGSVTANEDMGGFIGYIEGDTVSIDSAYTAMALSSVNEATIGGFLGGTGDIPTISNSFAAVTLDAGASSGAISGSIFSTDSFVEVYYDYDLSGEANCISFEEPFAGCIAVNTDGSDPEYFINNSTNAPLAAWDFTPDFGVWVSTETTYPYLRTLGNPYPIPPNAPTDIGPAAHVTGQTITETQPNFTFTITDPEEVETVGYTIIISTSADTADAVIEYQSALAAQGAFSFTVGQAAGGGTYTTGAQGQELEDGTYYVFLQAVDEDEEMSDQVAVNGGDAAFTINTPSSEGASSSNGGGGGGGSRSLRLKMNSSGEGDSGEDILTYEEELQLVRERGLIEKEMETEANKCEVLVIMARALHWEIGDESNDGFTDTPIWCKKVAKYAKDQGIVNGRTEGQLGMDTPLSRYEFVVMLYRALQGSPVSEAAPFTDNIVGWAQEAVDWAYIHGYIKGFATGKFGGEQGILKQDVGVILLRIMLAQEAREG